MLENRIAEFNSRARSEIESGGLELFTTLYIKVANFTFVLTA